MGWEFASANSHPMTCEQRRGLHSICYCDAPPVVPDYLAAYGVNDAPPWGFGGIAMRIDVLEGLALIILVVAVFVAARTWGRGSTPASVALLVLAAAQALWVLGIMPPVGQFG